MHHFLCIPVVHKFLVLMMCHFFWSLLTLQDTSYSPEPHISADCSQNLLSAREAVSLWFLGTRKVCISAESLRDAILTHCSPSINVVFFLVQTHKYFISNFTHGPFFCIFAFFKFLFPEWRILVIRKLVG